MKTPLFKNKWIYICFSFLLATAIYAFVAIEFHASSWINSWLTVGGTIFGVTAAASIMFFNKECMDKSTAEQIQHLTTLTNEQIKSYKEESNKQIEHLQQSTAKQMEHLSNLTNQQIQANQQASKEQISTLQSSSEKQMEHLTKLTAQQIQSNQEESKKQIDHIQLSTEKQIKALQEATAKQMEHISELTNSHISAYKNESQKQIKAVKDATDAQIKSFVEQTNEITNRLEEASEILALISKLNEKMLQEEKELRKIEEEKALAREVELLKQKEQFDEVMYRFKPNLQFRLYDDTQLLLWHYIFVQIYNGGGDATTIQFEITFENSYTNEGETFTQSFSNIGRGRYVTFKTGRTKHLKGYDKITIKASAWDVNQIEYFSHLWWWRNDGQWNRLDSSEKKQLVSINV